MTGRELIEEMYQELERLTLKYVDTARAFEVAPADIINNLGRVLEKSNNLGETTEGVQMLISECGLV